MRAYDNIKAQEKQVEKKFSPDEKIDREMTKKWAPLKLRNERFAASLDRIGLDGRAARAYGCGTWWEFRQEESGHKLVHANFCRDRLCPLCNVRRSMKIFRQTSDMMDWIEEQGNYRYVFLTLTVRNCTGEDLPGTMDVILRGWNWLTHESKQWKRSVLGSQRNVETTRNPIEETWHPHIHAVLVVPNAYFDRYSKYWISQREWAALWQEACGLDYGPIVHVEAVKGPRWKLLKELSGGPDKQSRVEWKKLVETITKDENLSWEYRAAVAAASQYMSKDGSESWLGAEPEIDQQGQLMNPYAVLDDAVVDANVRVMLEAMSGRKLLGRTGLFRKAHKALQLDDAENGDLVHIDKDSVRADVAEVLIRYDWRNGVFVRG